MTTGYDILRDIEVEMEKLASAYEVVATELTKRANDEGRGYGTYAGIGAAGLGAGMAAGIPSAYQAMRENAVANTWRNTAADATNRLKTAFGPEGQAQIARRNIAAAQGDAAMAARNAAMKSFGARAGIGAGVGLAGAAGLGVYDYLQNRPVVQDVEGQTKAASLRNLLARLG